MRIFHQNESFLLAAKTHSITDIFWRREGAKQAALILIKNSYFNRTPKYFECLLFEILFHFFGIFLLFFQSRCLFFKCDYLKLQHVDIDILFVPSSVPPKTVVTRLVSTCKSGILYTWYRHRCHSEEQLVNRDVILIFSVSCWWTYFYKRYFEVKCC